MSSFASFVAGQVLSSRPRRTVGADRPRPVAPVPGAVPGHGRGHRVRVDAGDGRKTICLLLETGQGGWQYSLPMLDGVARDGGSVLITGETETGEELLARYLHDRNCCADRPYVTINCTGLSEQLMRRELFGWKRGSFTGANEDYDGLIRQAQGGTVFLDEIGNMDPQNQGRLLRSLQTGEIQPLGEPTRRVQARVIAATNKPVGPGDGDPCMIEDLFYRFRFSDMRIPALRDRGDNVFRLLLSPGFLDQTKFTGITAQTLCRLADDPWCGNIRDLHRYCRNRSLGAGGRPPETDKPPHILDDQMPKGDRHAWYGFAVFCLWKNPRAPMLRFLVLVSRAGLAQDVSKQRSWQWHRGSPISPPNGSTSWR